MARTEKKNEKEKRMLEKARDSVMPFVEDILGGKFAEPPRIQTSPLPSFYTIMSAVFYHGPTQISEWLNMRTAMLKDVAIQYPESNSIWIYPKMQYPNSLIAHEMTHIFDYYTAQHPLLKLAAAGGRNLLSIRSKDVFEFVALRCLAEGRALLIEYLYETKESENALERIFMVAEKRMIEYKDKEKKEAPLDSLLHIVGWVSFGLLPIAASVYLSTHYGDNSIARFLACGLLISVSYYLLATSIRYDDRILMLLFHPKYRLAFLSPYTPGLYFMTRVAKELGVKEAFRITIEKPPQNLEEILNPELYLARVGQSAQM